MDVSSDMFVDGRFIKSISGMVISFVSMQLGGRRCRHFVLHGHFSLRDTRRVGFQPYPRLAARKAKAGRTLGQGLGLLNGCG